MRDRLPVGRTSAARAALVEKRKAKRPEVKAAKRAYSQRPEVKAAKRAYMHDYSQRPEVKAAQRVGGVRSSLPDNPRACRRCGAEYPSIGTLRRHERDVHGRAA